MIITTTISVSIIGRRKRSHYLVPKITHFNDCVISTLFGFPPVFKVSGHQQKRVSCVVKHNKSTSALNQITKRKYQVSNAFVAIHLRHVLLVNLPLKFYVVVRVGCRWYRAGCKIKWIRRIHIKTLLINGVSHAQSMVGTRWGPKHDWPWI